MAGYTILEKKPNGKLKIQTDKNLIYYVEEKDLSMFGDALALLDRTATPYSTPTKKDYDALYKNSDNVEQ